MVAQRGVEPPQRKFLEAVQRDVPPLVAVMANVAHRVAVEHELIQDPWLFRRTQMVEREIPRRFKAKPSTFYPPDADGTRGVRAEAQSRPSARNPAT